MLSILLLFVIFLAWRFTLWDFDKLLISEIFTPREDNNSKKKKVSVNFGMPKIDNFLSVNKQQDKIGKEDVTTKFTLFKLLKVPLLSITV